MATPLELLKKKKEEALENLKKKGKGSKKKIYVGSATCELAAGSKEVMEVFKSAQTKGDLKDVYLSQKGCAGRCNLEPTVEVIEEGKGATKYIKVTPAIAQAIIDRHIKKGEIVKEAKGE